MTPFVPIGPVYSSTVAMSVRNWLASMQEWQVQQSDHYRFEGVDLNYHASKHVGDICHLVAPTLLGRLERIARSTWGVVFGPAFHLEAHRFRVGDYAAPHTDADLSEVRTVITFPSPNIQGGDLVFYGKGGSALAPKANEGAMFICSDESAHSVTQVQRGHRYSVCYRFEALGTERQSA